MASMVFLGLSLVCFTASVAPVDFRWFLSDLEARSRFFGIEAGVSEIQTSKGAIALTS